MRRDWYVVATKVEKRDECTWRRAERERGGGWGPPKNNVALGGNDSVSRTTSRGSEIWEIRWTAASPPPHRLIPLWLDGALALISALYSSLYLFCPLRVLPRSLRPRSHSFSLFLFSTLSVCLSFFLSRTSEFSSTFLFSRLFRPNKWIKNRRIALLTIQLSSGQIYYTNKMLYILNTCGGRSKKKRCTH